MEKVTTTIKINKNMDVIIPSREETVEEMETRYRLLNIKDDWKRQQRRMRNRRNNYIKRLGDLVAGLFI